MRKALLLMLAAMGASAEGPIVEGNPKGAARVIIYEDLQCSDCAVLRKMLDEKLLPKYKDKIAFEHRDFPLAKHAWARPAAVAARFFYEKNPQTGLDFRRFALLNQKAITPDNFQAKLAEFAKKSGVDPAQALASLEDKRLTALVEKEYQEGVARGVAKTPTAFVNGQPFVETFTFEEISQAIDKVLKP